MEATALAAEARVDKSPTKDEALKHAILATELYMKAVKLASNEQERTRLRGKCKQLLARAEEIKKSDTWTPKTTNNTVLRVPASERAITTTEKIILLEGSKLHGFIFPPWDADPDESIFNDDKLYTDATDLELSQAQREIFAGWRRPQDIFGRPPDVLDPDQDPLSMKAVNEIDLVQDITTDCSVVASLCASTSRALKGHERIFASMIFPYDKTKLRTQVSRNGKYIFRLYFNGCYRKVVIDDRLPTSNSSRSLHVVDRNNPKLLWPALLEKAYLKVRGGYDFPGSNSGTDLWVLTGWIPEQVFLQSDDLQAQQLWGRTLKSFGFGDVMITLGTGKLSRKEEGELGLAGEHDYAVLDMKEVGSQRLLLVKNPWCDGMIWKRSILTPPSAPSTPSSQSWTQELTETLPTTTPPPGTFWMSVEDVIQHFESLYLNWNPGLFLHRQDHHFTWTLPAINTPGSFARNPQYAVSSSTKETIWVLLSRHFATAERAIIKHKPTPLAAASSALGFISLYIFEASGCRVYLSDDAFHRGAFVDSPQTLATLEADPSTSYTIVIAQHGLPLPKYAFSLSFFSRSPLTVTHARDDLSHCTTHTGSWTSSTAGGNASSPSYPLNPQFSISVPSTTDITLVLETDHEELAVHVKMAWGDGQRVSGVTAKDILGGSGDYRRGCAMASLRGVAKGKYTIVCSTFEAGQTGHFTLRIYSTVPCTASPIPPEAAGRLSQHLPVLVFQDGIDRMLAPLSLSRLTRLRVVARHSLASEARRPAHPHEHLPQVRARSRPLLRISVEQSQGPNKSVLHTTSNGAYSDAPMGIRTADVDLSPVMMARGGLWIVVERMGRAGVEEVQVEVLSDGAVGVGVGVWGTGDG